MEQRRRHGSVGSEPVIVHQRNGSLGAEPSTMTETQRDISGSSYLSVTVRNIVKSTITSDDDLREPLKPWRKRLREICSNGNAVLLDTILSDKIPILDRYTEFVADKKDLSIEVSEPIEEYEELKSKNKKILDEYLTCLERMFELYAKIEDKITELEELEQEFVSLSCLEEDDGSTELSLLQTSIQAYIQKKYEASTVAEDYASFKQYYRRWKSLRSVILQAHVAQDVQGGPYCSICTTDRVNTALIPCGHTYCNNCGQKQKSACFICRTSVKERLRIFFT